MRNALIILFLLLLFSCKKEDETLVTTIEGIVVNTGSKEPVDSVKVIAVDGVSNYDPFFGSSDNPGTGKYVILYTNKQGKFSVSIKGNYPCIFLVKDGYRFVVFTYGSSENYKTYVAGKTYKNEFLSMVATAYFNPVIRGFSCLPDDSVYIDAGTDIPPMRFLKSENCFFGNGPS